MTAFSPPHRGRVLLGASGGVDSSVAALLLLREGWSVEAVTLDLLGVGDREGGAVSRAARVCALLGIPHHVVDGRGLLRERVVTPFLADYGSGRTPNPCVLCNERVKFPLLLDEMAARGFDRVATGHYATISCVGDGAFSLSASVDPGKDQSYFLYRLGAAVLSKTLFPVGHLAKRRVKEIAREAGIPAADEEESQDVCFLENRAVSEFLEEEGVRLPPGEIVDRTGAVLGEHEGIHRFTVGQRKGLGVSSSAPLYVRSLDPGRNRLVVAGKDDSRFSGAEAVSLRFPDGDPPPSPFPATARIRYRHPGVACTAEREGDRLRVRFAEPQGGVAPGQSLVLYEGTKVVGGGIIRCPFE